MRRARWIRPAPDQNGRYVLGSACSRINFVYIRLYPDRYFSILPGHSRQIQALAAELFGLTLSSSPNAGRNRLENSTKRCREA
jgi:hypothetical protein